MANTDQQIANNDQEVASLNRRSEDSLHSTVDIPTEDLEFPEWSNNNQEMASISRRSEYSLHPTVDIPTEDLEPVPEWSIYKVPKRMRLANEAAYTPQMISIGPFHHGNELLAPMERKKLRYYEMFSQRISNEKLNEFSEFIERTMEKICKYYDMDLLFDTESNRREFIKMILYDAVFIIEFFLRKFQKRGLESESVSQEIENDLMLLENQLPFFVLKELYNSANIVPPRPSSFLDLACSFFGIYGDERLGQREFKHFTDLIRSTAVSNCPQYPYVVIDHMYSATKLREAGVTFKALNDNSDLSINVKFENGVLEMPTMLVGFNTERKFRNLMAFELCHDSKNAHFCNFIQFMDYLIDTDKDVDILIKRGIIRNQMGSSQAVADMFNELRVGVPRLDSSFDKIGKDLNEYYDSFWNRTWATLKHVYFNNLWRGTATVAAFIVVMLTLTQTILAILDRAMPTKK